jgi:hypothetical protein
VSQESPRRPYRWDLVAPDQLGSLLDGTVSPSLFFLSDLVECAGKVVARSGGGVLVFVGRSLDSMFDLLSGAFADDHGGVSLSRLPVSFSRVRARSVSRLGWRGRPLAPAERDQIREMLAEIGLTPSSLARRRRPVAFVDVVAQGTTFGELFTVLREWIDEEHTQWDVIRRKLRFVGVTSRGKTSPKAYRWQQHASWTRSLPARAVMNVSLPYHWAWHYFGDVQVKLTRSHRPEHWLADAESPDRDDKTRQALAEAVALVSYGRSQEGRKALARVMAGEPAMSQAWLRSLVAKLNSPA